ncbi:MAG TPA: hypothetical protein VFV78_03875 [Vicinamibacterales bacterium]|nr:hypothetical protein [Vicinamibacterales bacterium]
MASDDIDRAEVDRLVTELAHPPKPKPRPSAFAALAAEAMAPKTATQPARFERALQAESNVAAGRAWTTANVLMPAVRTERPPRKRFALPKGLSLPAGFPLPGRPSLPRVALPRDLSFRSLRRAAMNKWRATQWSAWTVRTFVGLGVLLCAAMPYWPYAHAWSWGLAIYLCASEMVVVTGIWGAKLTWDAHLPAAHTVAVGTTIWGLGLMAVEAIPRMSGI